MLCGHAPFVGLHEWRRSGCSSISATKWGRNVEPSHLGAEIRQSRVAGMFVSGVYRSRVGLLRCSM